MTDPLERYVSPARSRPTETLTWRLHGAGMDAFGRDGKPERVPLPPLGPREVLTRVDALGVCFSDTKLIGLGAEHARVYGRDLAADPVVPGHEVSLTIIAVGSELGGRFRVGERYIVQADAIYHGEARAYGYALAGGMTQYGIVGERIIDGDEGCYLIPVRSDIGYAEAALTEPWACVEASYRIKPRGGLKPGGVVLFLGLADGRFDEYVLSRGLEAGAAPATIVAANLAGKFGDWLRGRARELSIPIVAAQAPDAEAIAALKATHAPHGFDDIVVLGSSDADLIEAAAAHLAIGGVMNIVSTTPLSRALRIDVGRIHYDGTDYVGGPGPDIADSYSVRESELARGPAWFIGAGGPLGQMHVQRAAARPDGPEVIVATDVDDVRLAALEAKCRAGAGERCRLMMMLNPKRLSPDAFDAELRRAAPDGFSDIVVLAPVPALIEQAAAYLSANGSLNIFAGLARGTTATLNLSDVYLRKARWVGSSGSRIADLEYTLRLTEAGKLSPNSSVAALGDITAVRDGLDAVKSGAFAGKVVIFPHIEGVPLTSLRDLRERLPEVHARLGPGETWTREAERELLRLKLRSDGGAR